MDGIGDSVSRSGAPPGWPRRSGGGGRSPVQQCGDHVGDELRLGVVVDGDHRQRRHGQLGGGRVVDAHDGDVVRCGEAVVPHAGKDRKTSIKKTKTLDTKPGSAGKAMPGFDVRVVDDSGKEVPKGTMGNIVMGMPLAPTGFRTLWQDEDRFYKGYLKRFDGKWIDTGDAGMIDDDGYIHVMSRSDDIINVAAHRFSTGAFSLFGFAS